MRQSGCVFKMKLSSKEERINPILKRKEMAAIIEHDGGATPSKASLQHFLAKETGAHVECVDIRHIFSFGGAPKSEIKVFIWEEKKVPDLSKVVKKEEKKKEE